MQHPEAVALHVSRSFEQRKPAHFLGNGDRESHPLLQMASLLISHSTVWGIPSFPSLLVDNRCHRWKFARDQQFEIKRQEKNHAERQEID